MAEYDVCTLGAATRNSETNVVTVEVSRETGLDGEAEPMGTAPMLMAVGLTALPAGPSDTGHAEGVLLSPCGPYTAAIVGGTDSRCADVIGLMKAGETCAHNTGGTPETRARTFYKENCISSIVGNDLMLILDRKNEKIVITGFGHIFEMSKAQGVIMGAKGGTNGIQLKEDGSVTIWGSVVNIGGLTTAGTPATSVLMGPAGMAGVPAPNVFITL